MSSIKKVPNPDVHAVCLGAALTLQCGGAPVSVLLSSSPSTDVRVSTRLLGAISEVVAGHRPSRWSDGGILDVGERGDTSVATRYGLGRGTRNQARVKGKSKKENIKCKISVPARLNELVTADG